MISHDLLGRYVEFTTPSTDDAPWIPGHVMGVYIEHGVRFLIRQKDGTLIERSAAWCRLPDRGDLRVQPTSA